LFVERPSRRARKQRKRKKKRENGSRIPNFRAVAILQEKEKVVLVGLSPRMREKKERKRLHVRGRRFRIFLYQSGGGEARAERIRSVHSSPEGKRGKGMIADWEHPSTLFKSERKKKGLEDRVSTLHSAGKDLKKGKKKGGEGENGEDLIPV